MAVWSGKTSWVHVLEFVFEFVCEFVTDALFKWVRFRPNDSGSD